MERHVEEFIRKDLPTFNFFILLNSCVFLLGSFASPPQRKSRLVAGTLSFLLFLKTSISIAHLHLDLDLWWFNLVNRKALLIHITSSMLLLIAIGIILGLGATLE